MPNVVSARFDRAIGRAFLPPAVILIVLGSVMVGAIVNLLVTIRSVDRTDRLIAQTLDFQRQVLGIELALSEYALKSSRRSLELGFEQTDEALSRVSGHVAAAPHAFSSTEKLETDYRYWRRQATRLRSILLDGRRPSGVDWWEARGAIASLHGDVETFLRAAGVHRDTLVRRSHRATTVSLLSAVGLTLLAGIGIVRSTRGQLLSLAASYNEALTAAERQHEAIRVSESRFRDLFEATMVGSFVADADGVLMDANDAFLQMVGYDRADVSEHRLKLTDLAIPQQIPILEQIAEQSRITGVLKPFETTIVKRDGERSPVLAGAKWFNDGSNQCIAFVVDISESKRVEEERMILANRERHRLKQVRALASTSLAMNSELDVNSLLQIVTDAAAEIIGVHQAVTSVTPGSEFAVTQSARYQSSERSHLRNKEMLPSDSAAQVQVCRTNSSVRLTEEGLNADPAWTKTRFQQRRGGSMRGWLAVPLVGRDGHNLGLIQLSDKAEGDFNEEDEAVLTQLAQMASIALENARLYNSLRERELERELLLESERRARTEAERASRMKDEFLSNLSHELKTPLNAIVGWAELLEEDRLDDVERAQALDIIQRNANIQMQLINDLLDMSRIISGKMELDSQILDVGLVLEQAIESIRPAAEQKNIEIERDFAPGESLVEGDMSRLQQVFGNLLTNSLKFTPTGGQIVVSLRVVDERVVIDFKDNGMGIEQEFLPYVFDRFRQADASSRRRFGGLGLGLAIVKQLVELHHGVVTAASDGPGHGATFSISLPLAREGEQLESAPASGAPSAQNLPTLDQSCLLVAIQDQGMRSLITKLLSQAGARVLTSFDNEQALELIAREHPDALICDVPSGTDEHIDLVRRVRDLPPAAAPHTPVVALVADEPSPADAELYSSWLLTPIYPGQLLTEVGRAIGRQSNPHEVPANLGNSPADLEILDVIVDSYTGYCL